MILRTVLIILAAFVLFALIKYYNTKQQSVKSEKFYEQLTQPVSSFEKVDTTNVNDASGVLPSEELSDSVPRNVDFESTKVDNDCFPRDRLTAEDLLPKDASNSKWAQVNPAGQGDVKDQNYLSGGYMIGINTVGSSLRNANLQLRSEPIIPKQSIGPFLNSSYEPSDILRRPLEIGENCA